MAELTRLEIRAGSSAYQVVVGHGASWELPSLLEEAGLSKRLRIVADELVAEKYGSALIASLEAAGRTAAMLTISGQERHKNLASVSRVYDWLIDVGTDRSDAVIAFGGGVVGDLAGFAAATFLRGIRLVHLPTTLLAMVDSSIGGKTGVDHPRGKNLVGAFYQPRLVVADLTFLTTLPRRELAAGWAEVIKMGIIRSPELFDQLERTPEAMLKALPESAEAIARSIQLKGEVVSADEREADLRMVLNYGHTIGHAIEAITSYERFLHGEAVAIGMIGAADIAVRQGLFSEEDRARQNALLERFGLPDRCAGLSVEKLREAMGRDKKAVSSRLRWVLARRIGQVHITDDVPENVVGESLAQLVQD